jgi:hypothetical protein
VPRFLTRPSRVIPVALLLVLAVGAAFLWRGAHSSTAASEDTALAAFHERGGGTGPGSPGTPAPGVYRFRQKGSESAGSGPLSVSRDLPPEAIYIVNAIPGGYHEDLRLAEEHVEEVRFQESPDGVRAHWRRTKVTFLGIGEDERDDVTPPSLDHPADLTVGKAWSGRYRQGETAVSFSAKVTGRETLALDGRRIPVLVVRTVSDFTGPTHGTRTDTLWWSPKLSLPLRWTIAQKTGGENDYEISDDLVLESATPVT